MDFCIFKTVSLQTSLYWSAVCRLSQGPSKRNYVFCVRIKLIRRHSLLLDDVLLPAPICQCRRSFYLCFRSIIPCLDQLLFLHRPGWLSIMLIYANETPHRKNCMIYIYFFTTFHIFLILLYSGRNQIFLIIEADIHKIGDCSELLLNTESKSWSGEKKFYLYLVSSQLENFSL